VALVAPVVVSLALAAATASAWYVLGDPGPVLSHARSGVLATAAALVGGSGLLLAGAVAVGLRADAPSTGILLACAGVSWSAAGWLGWLGGPEAVVSLAMVLVPFLLPVVVHLLVATLSGSAGRAGDLLVACGYGMATVTALGHALLRDPFRDPYCWPNCTVNSFLLVSEPSTARLLSTAWLFGSAVLALLAAGLGVRALSAATAVARRAWWPVAVPAAAFCLVQAVYAVVRLLSPREVSGRTDYETLYVVRGGVLALLAAGVVGVAVRSRMRATAVRRFAAELTRTSAHGTLEGALAAATGDQSLQVAYQLPEQDAWVNARGVPIEPRMEPDQRVTELVRGSSPVACVVHDVRLDPDLWRHSIGPAATVAVDNERLRAAALYLAGELRASRRSIVTAADEARRSLERDLHDGAQQLLLAVLFELRLAGADAGQHGAEPRQRWHEEGSDLALRAVQGLRELGAGMFPAVLGQAGIGPALRTLADRAPLVLEVHDDLGKRLPTSVEVATYFVVRSCLDQVATGGGNSLRVLLSESSEGGAQVRVDVEPHLAGVFTADLLERLNDRAGALGGLVQVEGAQLTAVIPCE
jgi:signal transduction histidine kinase